MVELKEDWRKKDGLVSLNRAELKRYRLETKDYAEIGFKGISTITKSDLNPNPLQSKQLRNQTCW